MNTVACVLPLGTAVAKKFGLALYAKFPATFEKTVAVLMLVPQLSAPDTTPHFPLLDVRVKPEPEAAAVKVAHVPVVYHVPPLMIHPSAFPPVVTCNVPLPENGVPGLVVGPDPAVVVVVVGGLVVPLGRYLIPVAGQEDLLPSGFVGMKSPVWTEPFTS